MVSWLSVNSEWVSVDFITKIGSGRKDLRVHIRNRRTSWKLLVYFTGFVLFDLFQWFLESVCREMRTYAMGLIAQSVCHAILQDAVRRTWKIIWLRQRTRTTSFYSWWLCLEKKAWLWTEALWWSDVPMLFPGPRFSLSDFSVALATQQWLRQSSGACLAEEGTDHLESTDFWLNFTQTLLRPEGGTTQGKIKQKAKSSDKNSRR